MKDRVRETGRVATRRCPTCGHHEVGFVDEEGVFRTLTPGQPVGLLEENGAPGPGRETQPDLPAAPSGDSRPSEVERVPWVPEPLRDHRTLAIVFGVLIPEASAADPPSPSQYRAAYLEKLRTLVAGEEVSSLAVTLDRFFAAPYLASGTPEQIALALWKELDEIRAAAEMVVAWLGGTAGDLRRRALALVGAEDEGGDVPPDSKTLCDDLASLQLEAYLELIV